MASITFNVIVKFFYFSLAFWGFGQSLTTIIYDHIKFKWHFNFFHFLLWVGDLFHMGIDYFLDTNLGSTFLAHHTISMHNGSNKNDHVLGVSTYTTSPTFCFGSLLNSPHFHSMPPLCCNFPQNCRSRVWLAPNSFPNFLLVILLLSMVFGYCSVDWHTFETSSYISYH